MSNQVDPQERLSQASEARAPTRLTFARDAGSSDPTLFGPEICHPLVELFPTHDFAVRIRAIF